MIDFKPLSPEQRAVKLLTDVIRPSFIIMRDELGFRGDITSTAIQRAMVAVSWQEANIEYRDQQESLNGKLVDGALGPALGLWQFERGGGVAGIMRHAASASFMLKACQYFGVAPTRDAVWRQLKSDDAFAAVAARMLFFTDPWSIPADQQGLWRCYDERLWRPGKPLPAKWSTSFALGSKAVEIAS